MGCIGRLFLWKKLSSGHVYSFVRRVGILFSAAAVDGGGIPSLTISSLVPNVTGNTLPISNFQDFINSLNLLCSLFG